MASARDPDEITRTSNDAGGVDPRAAERDAGLVLLYATAHAAMPAVFVLHADSYVVGRGPGSLVIPDSTVSRAHARLIRRADGAISIIDLESRNGVLVRGKRVRESALMHGDEVRIGDALFKFVAHGASAYAPYPLDGPPQRGAHLVTIKDAVGGMKIARLSGEVATVAPGDLSVLVFGETGTGKELVARALHTQSGRGGPFRALNCAAIPPNLVESELFGWKRGAFSGATRDHPGIIRAAHGGTLLLDEIGDMPLEAQSKLLRTLETREVVPVGGVTPESVDVRIVGATHRDLRALVEAGAFRADLYARLDGYTLTLPPLRERKEDLYRLVRHFLARAGADDRALTFRFMLAICQYDWPYNVRELASAVKRALTVAEGNALDAPDLPDAVHALPTTAASTTPSIAPPGADAARLERPDAAALAELLRQHGGNVAAVARVFQKDRAQIHRWMRQLGIDPDAFR